MTRKVFIALPCHDGALRIGTVMSLIPAIADGLRNGIEYNVQAWVGDSVLPHARNVLVGKFLAGQEDDMVFWDTDISCAPGSLQQLLEHPVDFVGATYRFKSDKEGYPMSWMQAENVASEYGLFEVARVPSGFFRMTRKGLERVIAKCPHLAYAPHTAPDVKCWYLFHQAFEDGKAWGEDYAFCNLIRSVGEQVWLDPNLAITHSGQKEYTGHFGAFLLEQQRVAASSEEQEAVRNGKLVEFAKSFLAPEMNDLFDKALGKAA